MRTKLWRDSLENEIVGSWSFQVRFSGGGSLYVQIPGKWHIFDESRVPPGHLNLLCVVKIVFFGDLGKQYKLPTPLKRQLSGLELQGLMKLIIMCLLKGFNAKEQISLYFDDN